MKNSVPQKLLLAGAGHAHANLLRRLSHERLANIEVTLITEQPDTLYSGMLPSWMAGHYPLSDISIDAKSLCARAGVRFIQQSLAAVNATSHQVTTADNQHITYDLLSLNTGADTNIKWLNQPIASQPSANQPIANQPIANQQNSHQPSAHNTSAVMPIRPIYPFVERWQHIMAEAQLSDDYQLAIVGSGAAAVELVLAAQYRLKKINKNHHAYLICGDELLPNFNQRFRQKVIQQLERHHVKITYARAKGYSKGQLCTDKGHLSVNAVIAATGVTGSAWTQHTDLQTVDGGFIAVNKVQQSVSHETVFAVGDVATRVDIDMAHSGVHAVFGGAIAADNLIAYLTGKPLKTYRPKNRILYLLSCGDKYAIGSWGNYSLQGRWVWYLKRYIDKRFVHSFSR